jgi:hypothetical protein
MRSHDFFNALPEATRPRLPKALQPFKAMRRSWLAQLYYVDPMLHYEVWNLGARRGGLEVGLHFESKNAVENERLLVGFQSHLFEIKAELGESVEAEAWDKGWTKVYEVIPLEPFTPDYLERVTARLAEMIVVMQPIFEKVYKKRRS